MSDSGMGTLEKPFMKATGVMQTSITKRTGKNLLKNAEKME